MCESPDSQSRGKLILQVKYVQLRSNSLAPGHGFGAPASGQSCLSQLCKTWSYHIVIK